MERGLFLIARNGASVKRRPGPDPRGIPDRGRIVKLFIGQGYGFIRLSNDRDVYFHRTDLERGVSINDCAVGDDVSFERIDDDISGPRARCIQRQHGNPIV